MRDTPVSSDSDVMIVSSARRTGTTQTTENACKGMKSQELPGRTHPEFGCLQRRHTDPLVYLSARRDENAACGAQCGAPQMRGALMSARYDMEAAEPNVGQLLERVELMQVSPSDTVEVKSLVEVQNLSDPGLGLTVRAA